MGQLDVHIRHGGGGGPDIASLIVPAVAVGIAWAVAVIVMEFIWWIIAVAVAALVLWWKFRVIPKRRAAIAAAFAREHEILAAAARERRQSLERHMRALELARASAPVIHNIIDPSLIAAALAGAKPQPVTIRAEVER